MTETSSGSAMEYFQILEEARELFREKDVIINKNHAKSTFRRGPNAMHWLSLKGKVMLFLTSCTATRY